MVNIVEFIPYGNDNPVTREELCARTGMSDRAVRDAIANARVMYPIINLSDGRGYYIADSCNDPEAKRFYKQELHRIKSISNSLAAVRIIVNKPKDKNKQITGQISLFEGGEL